MSVPRGGRGPPRAWEAWREATRTWEALTGPGVCVPGRPRRKEGREPGGGQLRAEYAETGEPFTRERGGQESGACRGHMARTCRIGPTMPPVLQGIAQKAKSQSGDRCRTLYGRRKADCLKQWWRARRKDAAAGGDHVSAQA